MCNNECVFQVISEPCKKIFRNTPMIDNIEDVLVTRGKKRNFVTISSLQFKTYTQYVEIVSFDA